MPNGCIGFQFPEYKTPMDKEYHPELDDTPIVNSEMASHYHSMIGSLNWVITLGHFDTQFAVRTMAQYNNAPREGQIKAVIRILGYLKKFKKGKLLVDPSLPNHSQYGDFKRQDWQELYPDAVSEHPNDAPKPKGPKARITLWVNADHARDEITCCSVTGVLVMVSNMVIKTYSKCQTNHQLMDQNFCSMNSTDIAVEIHYLLQMVGSPIEGSTLTSGDYKSDILNTTMPSSVLKKKHNAIAYHRVSEAIAAEVINFVHIDSKINVADVLTKPLVNPVFHHLKKAFPVL